MRSARKFGNGAITAAFDHLFNTEAVTTESSALNVVVLYDGQAKCPTDVKDGATGADLKAIARATTKNFFDVTDADRAVEMMDAAHIAKGSVDYIIILDHDGPMVGGLTTQGLGINKLFTVGDAKILAPYLKPYGSFVFSGCGAGKDIGAMFDIAAATKRDIWANNHDFTSINRNTDFKISANRNNSWILVTPATPRVWYQWIV